MEVDCNASCDEAIGLGVAMLEVKPFSQRDRKYKELLCRGCAVDWDAEDEARRVVRFMRENCAEALKEYADAHHLHGDIPAVFRMGEPEMDAAKKAVSEQFLTAISLARVNSRRFHEDQRRRGYVFDDADGVRMIRQVRALERVGICCGNSFSSLLMHTVPAQLAGVGEIVAAVQPKDDGSVEPRILAAAKVLGITEVYAISGAHAVAAMAFGGPMRRVDKIVGNDGTLCQAAKRLVAGMTGIDPARGQGELLVIADDSANARFIAGDLIAQAEHGDQLSLLALFTTDRLLAEAVRIEVERLADLLPNPELLRRRIALSGANYVFPSLRTAAAAANTLAPARLSLQTRNNDDCLSDIDTAGAVFIGPWSAEASGDCFAGVNPFLPVGGRARFASGLGIEDFIREMSVVEYGPDRLLKTGRHLAILAEEEGMPAHAESVRERLELLKLTVD